MHKELKCQKGIWHDHYEFVVIMTQKSRYFYFFESYECYYIYYNIFSSFTELIVVTAIIDKSVR